MKPTKVEIFKKTWLWSVICGIVVAILFYFLSGIGNVFHWSYGGAAFIDLLMLFSIGGSYFGAGFVGWRIVDKYFHIPKEQFAKRYIRYSVITFILLVAVAYSPFSILGLLWSAIAPMCVLQSMRTKVPPNNRVS